MLLAASVVIIIALGLIFHTAIDRQMHSWKLLPEPEKLTELYFTHPDSLPSSYTPSQSQTVDFTVHNLEYQTTTYHYQIIEQNQDNNTSQTLLHGYFTLAQNQYKSPELNITPTDLGAHVKLSVRLVGQNESIDYLLKKGST